MQTITSFLLESQIKGKKLKIDDPENGSGGKNEAS
jgi:hypothetical protein